MKTLPIAWAKCNIDYEKNSYYIDLRNPYPETILTNGLDAALKTIEYICNHYPPPYTLCVTGGVDSQAMLYAWIISGKPFETFCAKYNGDYNVYDIENIDIFAKKYNHQITYYDVDVIKFLATEHDYYAKKYKCSSPQYTTHMKFADMINKGTIIYSGNFMRNKAIKDVVPNYFYADTVWGLYHFARLSNQNVVPWFFIETSDVAFGFHNSDKTNKNNDLYDNKVFLYEANGFPVIRQPKKTNGFEKLKEYYDTWDVVKFGISSPEISRNYRNFDYLYRRPYKIMYRFLKYSVKYDFE